jgi:type VI secretion system protein ImpI
MALRFTIENMTSLPDGGPTSFAFTGRRSVDIGRDQHLDWTLPDPSRFISGKH